MAKYVIEKYNIKYRNLFLLVFLGSKLIILANHKSNVTLKVYVLFQPNSISTDSWKIYLLYNCFLTIILEKFNFSAEDHLKS